MQGVDRQSAGHTGCSGEDPAHTPGLWGCHSSWWGTFSEQGAPAKAAALGWMLLGWGRTRIIPWAGIQQGCSAHSGSSFRELWAWWFLLGQIPEQIFSSNAVSLSSPLPPWTPGALCLYPRMSHNCSVLVISPKKQILFSQITKTFIFIFTVSKTPNPRLWLFFSCYFRIFSTNSSALVSVPADLHPRATEIQVQVLSGTRASCVWKGNPEREQQWSVPSTQPATPCSCIYENWQTPNPVLVQAENIRRKRKWKLFRLKSKQQFNIPLCTQTLFWKSQIIDARCSF